MASKTNVAIGFLTMGLFIIYGFLSIYSRDFAPNKTEWIHATVLANTLKSQIKKGKE